jgi:hypothetical protein
MLAKTPRYFAKPRKTYKQAIEPHRIPDLESFLNALEQCSVTCKKEGVQMDISRAIETLRHR